MNEEAILSEIERLSLQTTEKAPMQLLLELEQARGLAVKGNVACVAAAGVAGLVAFLGFGDRLDTLPPFGSGGGSFLYSCFVALVVFAVSVFVWRQVMDARVRRWFVKAERLIQARGSTRP